MNFTSASKAVFLDREIRSMKSSAQDTQRNSLSHYLEYLKVTKSAKRVYQKQDEDKYGLVLVFRRRL